MLVHEEWFGTDGDERWYSGDSGYYVPYTEDIGDLFRAFQREHGRCVGKITKEYIDDGSTHKIGWVFEKRMKYDDCNKTFLAHTSITFHERKPTVTIRPHFLHLN